MANYTGTYRIANCIQVIKAFQPLYFFILYFIWKIKWPHKRPPAANPSISFWRCRIVFWFTHMCVYIYIYICPTNIASTCIGTMDITKLAFVWMTFSIKAHNFKFHRLSPSPLLECSWGVVASLQGTEMAARVNYSCQQPHSLLVGVCVPYGVTVRTVRE